MVMTAHLHRKIARDSANAVRTRVLREKAEVARTRALEDAVAKINDQLCDFGRADGEAMTDKHFRFMFRGYHHLAAAACYRLDLPAGLSAQLQSRLRPDYHTYDIRRHSGELSGVCVRMQTVPLQESDGTDTSEDSEESD